MGSEGTTPVVWLEQDACSVAILTWRRPEGARNLVSGLHPGLLLVWVQRSDDDKEPTHE